MNSKEETVSLIRALRARDLDVFLYAGPIETEGYEALCDLLEGTQEKAKGVLLFLITFGGSPNAGYRIARALGHHYGPANFRVAIPAECKSAGTLICIGAHSLVIFDRGELGPLDVQFRKKDEIFEQSSGLDILRGMTYLRQEALDSFREYLLEINGGSGLSTKTASEIASGLVRGLFEPMFAQIDPVRLGEMNAALQIAHEYGTRLLKHSKSLKSGALTKLIHSYPTHGFVIDRAEARTIFERVEAPTADERSVADFALRLSSTKVLQGRPVVMDLLSVLETAYAATIQDDDSLDTANDRAVAEQASHASEEPSSGPAKGQPPVGGEPRARKADSPAQRRR